MSIRKKLFTIVVIVGCAASAAAGLLLWGTYTLQHKAQFVVPALNYLEGITKTSAVISNQSRLAADYMVTRSTMALEEFKRYSTDADIGFQEWKHAIQEQQLLDMPGETADLKTQASLEREYAVWRKETRAILEQRHVQYRPDGNPGLPPDDVIQATIDNSLEDGIEEVHSAYHNLLMSMGAFPWLVMASSQQMEQAHVAIDYFIAVIKTADGLNKQLKDVMNYLQSGDADHLEKLARIGIQTEDALAKWSEAVNRKRPLDKRDANDDYNLLQSVIGSHTQIENLIDLIIKLKRAGKNDDAIQLVKGRLQFLLDSRLLPAVTLAKADSKQEINQVSSTLVRTARSAVWQGLIAVTCVTLVITALLFRLMRLLSTSLTRIQSGIESIGTGNLDKRLNPQTSDELGRLAASLDAMTERLQRSYNENSSLNARLEQQIRQLEAANQEIEAFSYMVSHDLRSPVTAITGYAEMMLKEYAHAEERHSSSYLEKILNIGRRLTDLIEDILLLSRVAHMDIVRERFDASTAAARVMEDLTQREPGRTARFICQPDVIVNGSAQLLTILLENIIGNAWKYSRTRDETVIEFGALQTDGDVTCFVRDNGVGFDNADAEKIFLAFERLPAVLRKFEGTGIGLAIARKIVTCHHGRIWAESDPGHGAVFYFTLSGD